MPGQLLQLQPPLQQQLHQQQKLPPHQQQQPQREYLCALPSHSNSQDKWSDHKNRSHTLELTQDTPSLCDFMIIST